MQFSKSHMCIYILLLIFMSIFLPYPSHANPLDNWVTITSGTNHWFYGITYGNGIFVTVGDYGTILTSTDGVAWIPRTAGYTNHLYGVGFGNNTFVAVGTVGTILTSPDGVTWTLRTSGEAHPVSQNLFGVSYGVIGTSSTFVIVGGHGTILTSTDNGVNWTEQVSGTENWLYETIYKNSLFVDVGAYGTTIYSANGATWFPGNITPPNTYHLLGVAYGNSTFVAVGEAGTILTSPNGVNWNSQTPVTSDWLNGIDYNNGYFVAVGVAGTILTSLEGVNWTQRNSGTTYDLEAVAYDSNHSAFAAVGGYGTILLDGDTIPNPPVRIAGPIPIYFSTIQDAYDAASNGEVIQSQAWHLSESLSLDLDKSVTLKGGYDSLYTNNPSGTTINGILTISNGTVVMENIIIK